MLHAGDLDVGHSRTRERGEENAAQGVAEAGAPDYGWRESNANILTTAAPPYDRYLGSYQLRALLCRIYPNPDCTIEARYARWMAEN